MEFDFWHETESSKIHVTGNIRRDDKLVSFDKIETEKGEDILKLLCDIAPAFIEKLCNKIEREFEQSEGPDFMDRDDD